MHIRHVVVCDLFGSTILFPHYVMIIIFSKKRLLNIKCVCVRYSVRPLSEKCPILRRTKQDMIKLSIFGFIQSNHYSCQILTTLKISHRFSKNNQISNFMEIRTEGEPSRFMRTERRTGRHGEANSRFSLFCENT